MSDPDEYADELLKDLFVGNYKFRRVSQDREGDTIVIFYSMREGFYYNLIPEDLHDLYGAFGRAQARQFLEDLSIQHGIDAFGLANEFLRAAASGEEIRRPSRQQSRVKLKMPDYLVPLYNQVRRASKELYEWETDGPNLRR